MKPNSILNILKKCTIDIVHFNNYIYENFNIREIDLLTINDLKDLSGYNDLFLSSIMVLLFDNIQKGNVCLSLDEKIINKFKPFKEIDLSDSRNKILNYEKLIHYIKDDHIEFKPLIYDREKNLLYFQKYYLAEKNITSHFTEILNTKVNINSKIKIKPIMDNILIENPILLNKHKTIFNIEQKISLLLPFLNTLTIISGGPGTGKTSIIVNIIRSMIRADIDIDKIVIAAPTGKSAQQITDSIQKFSQSLLKRNKYDDSLKNIYASTIHRLLRYSFNKSNFKVKYLDADVVIIDEVSMIDIFLMEKLLKNLKPNCRIILIGDKDQLPSVGAGSILNDIISQTTVSLSKAIIKKIEIIFNEKISDNLKKTGSSLFTDKIIILNKNYRSAKEISLLAENINIQNSDYIKELPLIEYNSENSELTWNNKTNNSSVNLIPIYFSLNNKNKYDKKREITILINNWIENSYFIKNSELNYVKIVSLLKKEPQNGDILDKAFHIINRAKILSPVNNTIFGTEYINELVIKKLNIKNNILSNAKIFHGLPIIISNNDYKNNIFNGENGLIIKENNSFKAVFKKGDEYTFFPIEVIPFFKPAFCITIHKSQGSEYDNILLLLPEEVNEKIISKEILYTAVTRAKENLFIYSNYSTLSKLIKNRIERVSGFNFKNLS